MPTERVILNMLAATYTAQRDTHRAAKCRQVADCEALPLLEEYLAESHALLAMARMDIDRQLEMHSEITRLRVELDRVREDYERLVHRLLQRYPG